MLTVSISRPIERLAKAPISAAFIVSAAIEAEAT
jgi:hypothetical protein